MRFVLEAYRKTRRRTNLERWLLLACRCLLVAALAVGLARPLISGRSGELSGGRTVWFVIDDGLIGQSSVDGRSDLARAVERCKGVLASLGSGDRAALVLAGVPSRGVVMPPSGNIAGVVTALEELKTSDTPSDWIGALGLVGDGIVNDRSARGENAQGEDIVVVAQAARAGTGRIGESLSRLPAGVRLVSAEPEGAAPVNVAVAGVKALRPVLITGGEGSEAAQTVTVNLRRFGDGVEKGGTSRVSVRLLGQEGAVGASTVAWSVGQREASATLVIDGPRSGKGTTGAGAAVVVAEVETSGDGVTGDNTWRLPVLSREVIRVGVLADASARGSVVSGGSADRFRPGQWVSFALKPSESAAVELVEVEPAGLDASRLAGLDAVIVLSPEAVPAAAGNGAAGGWSRLKGFVDQGGLLIVTPAFDTAAQLWPEAMASGLGVGLSIGRAAKEYPADAPGRLSVAAPADAGGGDVLATLRGEFEVLGRPVAVSKLLAPLESSGPVGGESRQDVRVLVWMEDGAPFVTMVTKKAETAGERGGAVVYLSSAFDLKWTDLPAKPLMVPLMQELVRQGVGRARPVYVSTAGARAAVPTGTTELRDGAAKGATLAAEPAGRTAEPVRLAGAWRAVDAQGTERGVVAVNAPSEADTTPVARERLGAWLAGALPEKTGERSPEVEWADSTAWSKGLAALTVGKGDSRVGMGSMALIAALALALVEVLLARMASASSVRGSQLKGVRRG